MNKDNKVKEFDQVKYVVDVLTNWQGDDDPVEWFKKWVELNVTNKLSQARKEGIDWATLQVNKNTERMLKELTKDNNN